MTAEEIHILTRQISYDIFNEFGIALTIGIYAANDEGEYGNIKNELEKIVENYKEVLQVHGFYVDKSKDNVFFSLSSALKSIIKSKNTLSLLLST